MMKGILPPNFISAVEIVMYYPRGNKNKLQDKKKKKKNKK